MRGNSKDSAQSDEERTATDMRERREKEEKKKGDKKRKEKTQAQKRKKIMAEWIHIGKGVCCEKARAVRRVEGEGGRPMEQPAVRSRPRSRLPCDRRTDRGHTAATGGENGIRGKNGGRKEMHGFEIRRK